VTNDENGRDNHSKPEAFSEIDYEIIEALFFAYRDFVSDPDLILKEFKFGRAHHRIIHFVSRKPGLTVAELFDILKINKQSLAKVLKQLIQAGFIKQETSSDDRRQRHLYTTQKGQKLALKLSTEQAWRVSSALGDMKPEDRQTILMFLNGMINK
jgi:DNA-binding MarR family transcriptional regulator